MAKSWTVQEIIQIVSNGGGIDTSQRFTVNEGIQIASFAERGGARVTFRNTNWTAQEATRIASFGKGAVAFGD